MGSGKKWVGNLGWDQIVKRFVGYFKWFEFYLIIHKNCTPKGLASDLSHPSDSRVGYYPCPSGVLSSNFEACCFLVFITVMCWSRYEMQLLILNLEFSDFVLVSSNLAQWKYLYHGNWQMWQIRVFSVLSLSVFVFCCLPAHHCFPFDECGNEYLLFYLSKIE